MSLFTDLREVFTAYAQRIKSLAAADEQIKADLGDLDDLETESKTDLVSAINEASKSGLSDAGKEALIACFESIAIWGDGRGREHIEELRSALYVDRGAFEWQASSGELPDDLVYSAATLVDNTYYEITKPLLQLGLSATGGVVEVELALETASAVSAGFGIFAGSKTWKGTKMFFSSGNVVIANVTDQGASDNITVQNIDVTGFHKYKMVFDATHTDVYIDGEHVGRALQYIRYFMRTPVFGMAENNDKIRLKSIKYRYNGLLTPMSLKIYKGVGLSNDLSTFISNEYRCISDLFYFNSNYTFSLELDVPSDVSYTIKVIDTNGRIWSYNQSTDAYNVGWIDENDNNLAPNGWITSTGRTKIFACKYNVTPKTHVKLPNTNGCLRLLFKKADNSAFANVPHCTVYFNDGAVMTTEEGNNDEIL